MSDEPMTSRPRWMTLWAVEMWIPDTARWEPTTGGALTRAEAREVRRAWNKMNPDDRFRVRPYARIQARREVTALAELDELIAEARFMTRTRRAKVG